MYDKSLQAPSGIISCEKSLSITQRLELRKKKLEGELKEIEDVLVKLKANSEIQEVLDAVSKMNY